MERLLTVLAAALTISTVPGTSFAQPITDTEVEKISETFSDEPFLCQAELYEQAATGHVLTHFTAAGIDGDGNFILPLHFHFLVHARIVAFPSMGPDRPLLDTSGQRFGEHPEGEAWCGVRGGRHGSQHGRGEGSDGSKIRLQEHFHFTFNANGDVTIEFEKVTSSC